MSRVCPQCNQVTADATAFCIRCGYRFQGNEQVANEDATIRQINLPNVPPNADPSATLTSGNQQQAQQEQVSTGSSPNYAQQEQFPPASPPNYAQQEQFPPASPPNYAQPTPGGISYTPTPIAANPTPNQIPGGYMVPNTPPQGAYPQPVYGQAYGAPPAAAPGSGGVASLQRAFAGKGTPVHHQSWLLDGKQIQPAMLRNSLMENIHKQGVLGVSVMPEHLREQSVIMEERDFVKVQYGSASVFVYLAPMGSNLYVSRTSTIQQPVSRTRLVSLAGLFVLMLICYIFYSLVNPLGGSDDGTILLNTRVNAFFGLAANGLLLFFVFLLLRSVISWLSENDFLAFFRPNRLNDFTLDTLSSIEHITDKGVRETLKQAGLNADEITRPSQAYPPQLPLRRF